MRSDLYAAMTPAAHEFHITACAVLWPMADAMREWAHENGYGAELIWHEDANEPRSMFWYALTWRNTLLLKAEVDLFRRHMNMFVEYPTPPH